MISKCKFFKVFSLVLALVLCFTLIPSSKAEAASRNIPPKYARVEATFKLVNNTQAVNVKINTQSIGLPDCELIDGMKVVVTDAKTGATYLNKTIYKYESLSFMPHNHDKYGSWVKDFNLTFKINTNRKVNIELKPIIEGKTYDTSIPAVSNKYLTDLNGYNITCN